MPLRFHCIATQFPLDGRLRKDVRVIAFLQHIIGDMLNNDGCLFIVDQGRCLDDKFLRIELELLKNGFFNTGQDCDNRFSCQAGFFNQFAHQIVFHAAAHADLFAAVVSRRL